MLPERGPTSKSNKSDPPILDIGSLIIQTNPINALIAIKTLSIVKNGFNFIVGSSLKSLSAFFKGFLPTSPNIFCAK